MYHLILFAYLVTLLVGSVAITVTRQGARSGRHTALRPLTGFLVCFNLMSLLGFTMTYLMITFGTAWEEGGPRSGPSSPPRSCGSSSSA
jgi:threonine/homoserine/homoserine lactone efflux protein